MDTADYIALEDEYNAHTYEPLDAVLTKGSGVWVEDVDGKKYLDCLSAYSAVNQGHRHPAIVAAAKEQLDRLTLTSRAFHNDQMGPFLRQLCELTGYEKALPMNTGAEAVETAPGGKVTARHVERHTDTRLVLLMFLTVPRTCNVCIALAAAGMCLCGTCNTFCGLRLAFSRAAAASRAFMLPLCSTSIALRLAPAEGVFLCARNDGTPDPCSVPSWCSR